MTNKSMNSPVCLLPGERIDDLQRNHLKILQNPDVFCFGMDAVLLSGFSSASINDSVLDFCTGNGIVPILMEAKTQAAHFWGIEIQDQIADMAKRSIAMNNQQEKITIISGDIKNSSQFFSASSFDVLTVNPPYMTNGHGLTNPNRQKAIARHELLCTLDDVVKQAAHLLKPGGHLFMVHRPFRLGEIMSCLFSYHMEVKRMRFVHPYIDQEPNMVLIEATRGGRPRVTVEPPLIVWSAPNVYTKEMQDLYSF